MQTILTIIECAAALFVLWHAVCALNSMSHRSNHGMRAGVVLIAVGTFFEMAQVALFGHRPDLPETLTLLGLAIGTYFNRRTGRCPCLFDRRFGMCDDGSQKGAR